MEKKIVYAWANDAPSKKMPEGVGLRVGGDTDIQYMVLQLHYKKKFPGDFFTALIRHDILAFNFCACLIQKRNSLTYKDIPT